MEFVDKIYQFIIYVIETIKDLVSFFKNGMEDTEEPTIIDKTEE